MENSKNNTPGAGTWVTVFGAAIIALTALGIYQYNQTDNVRDMYESEVIKTEELNSKKDALQGEVDQLSAELNIKIAEAEAAKKELDRMSEEAAKSKAYSSKANNERNRILAMQKQKEAEIDSLRGELFALNEIKLKMEDDLRIIPELEQQNASLREEIRTWEQKFAALEADFKDLSNRYQKAIYDAPADNFNVAVTMKNGKLTSKARRAQNVTISFLMPKFLQREMKEKETLYLSLFDEKIEPVAGWMKEATINSHNGSVPVPIHSIQDFKVSKEPQVVSFTVALEEKLKPGFYQAKVYSANSYYGTVDFRLR
jgi:uncharacterized protein (DUF3084 family)